VALRNGWHIRASRNGLTLVFLAAISRAASAQTSEPIQSPPMTVLPHSDDTPWWLSGQINLVNQWHGAFPSLYQGENSFRPVAEPTLSRVWTIYAGVQLTSRFEVLLDVESAGGRGLSDALGLAGFTDLDVVRNPDLGAAPYVARVQVHLTVPLSREKMRASRGPMSLATTVPVRRLDIRIGKLSVVDTFDVNSVGSDSHLQFLNWTIDNNGAYDYAADTRGYTYGAIIDYEAPRWSLRGAEALMPTVANGIVLDWNLRHARGENLELELRPREGVVVRLLTFMNHANMGSYDEAIRAFEAGTDEKPDIEAHRVEGRGKAGVGINAEYALPSGVRLFGRAGWNDGRNESFAYTEVDHTAEIGGDVSGRRWNRPFDRVGAAAVSNGLSSLHRDYLRLGGSGFLLGDGTLTYGRETIVETYYTAHLWRGVFASADVQHIVSPGYNRDRGPVTVGTIRLHVDF
jgi:hypothetical protein